MSTHDLYHENGITRCRVCGWHWVIENPRVPCPGVPRYSFPNWPKSLATKTQLGKRGLKLAPGQQRVAVYYNGVGHFYRPLYAVAEAVPKRAVTEAQQVALAKADEALEAARHCIRCGGDLRPPRKNGTCQRCYDEAKRAMEEESTSVE